MNEKLRLEAMKMEGIEKEYFESLELRESKIRYKNLRQQVEHSLRIEKLMKEIKKIAFVQDLKFIRHSLPSRPQADPLPYKKKIREKIKIEKRELRTPTPEIIKVPPVICTRKLSFNIAHKTSESPVVKIPVKKFITIIRSKAV